MRVTQVGLQKKIGYDDLSIPQWVAGQLTNAIQQQNNETLRSVLIQILFIMTDTSSLPSAAIREAYAFFHVQSRGRQADLQ